MRYSTESLLTSAGVSVPATSWTGAKAVMIRLIGELTVLSTPSSCQLAFMDRLSFPTGMVMPSAGHSSSPTAYTASNSAASSFSSPQAAIQLADRVTSLILAMRADAILVTASPTARRADAVGLINATGARSPIAIASPVVAVRLVLVTAQSATGTW